MITVNTYYRKGKQVVIKEIIFYFRKWLIRTAFALLMTTVLSQAIGTYAQMFKTPKAEANVPVPVGTPDRLDIKIVELKQEVLTKLSACESSGTKEPEAAIILDSNSQMSIGSFMFQIKTIQFYVNKFEGRDISRKEAIEIAIDNERAENLAEQIIFEDSKGILNWKICSDRLGLKKQIEMIKYLTK